MNALLLASTAWLMTFAAPADELKRERVPADVDLVVHFDFEGFKQTQVWKHLAATLEKEELESELADLHELKSRFGIDPLTDLRAVTLFKLEAEEEPTVVLFSATAAIDEALRRFQAEPGYARLSASGIELHTWSEGQKDGEKVYAYVHAGAEERVVVLSSSQDSALHAARVLRGEDPSHAKAGTALTLAPARGSFLYVATSSIPHIQDTPASRVFGLAQGIQVDLGEAGGFLRAHMGITTASPKDAYDISNVLNGLISLARLAGNELGEALEILTGIRLDTRGSEVLFDFEFEVERLLELVQSLDGFEGLGHARSTHAAPEEPQEREGGKRRMKLRIK
ncbi:MAG: hypothetical protein HOP15_15330 [Planctomycetes bacterium]|nr:hypothetical protein [Planctomycetota bacterium]